MLLLLKNRNIASIPVLLNNKSEIAATSQSIDSERVTLVLPLTLSDLSRSIILFESLRKLEQGIVKEALIFAPDNQVRIIQRVIEVPNEAIPISSPVPVIAIFIS